MVEVYFSWIFKIFTDSSANFKAPYSQNKTWSTKICGVRVVGEGIVCPKNIVGIPGFSEVFSDGASKKMTLNLSNIYNI